MVKDSTRVSGWNKVDKQTYIHRFFSSMGWMERQPTVSVPSITNKHKLVQKVAKEINLLKYCKNMVQIVQELCNYCTNILQML